MLRENAAPSFAVEECVSRVSSVICCWADGLDFAWFCEQGGTSAMWRVVVFLSVHVERVKWVDF